MQLEARGLSGHGEHEAQVGGWAVQLVTHVLISVWASFSLDHPDGRWLQFCALNNVKAHGKFKVDL